MTRSLLIACIGLSILGCDKPAQPAADAAAKASKPGLPPAGRQTAGEPTFADAETPVEAKIEYDTKIENVNGKSIVSWTAKVPTGGWTMTTDSAPLVEERNTLWWVRVYVTLQAPDPKEMVAQGFQTLTGKFEADRKINRVEFSVRRTVKGDTSDLKPGYVVVKTGPDWVTDQDKAAK